MRMQKAAFFVLVGLSFGAFASQFELNESANKVLEVWTPNFTAPVQAADYANRRQRLEGQLYSSNPVQRVRTKINLTELKKCQSRGMTECQLSESLRRTQAFVLRDNVLQTVRRAFVLNVQQRFSALESHWGHPPANVKAADQIRAFKEDPLQEAVFVVTDREGNIVFSSGSDDFKFLRYGNVRNPKGRVSLTTKAKQKELRAFIFGEDSRLDSSDLNSLSWVANDFVQIKLEKTIPSLERAEIGECRPGSPLFAVRLNGEHDAQVVEGRVLSMEQFAIKARTWPYLVTFLNALRGRSYLTADIETSTAMEGGPLLDEHGRVCAILKENPGGFALTIPY